MAEPSILIPNLNEIMEEYTQTEGEAHLEPTMENRPSEQPEVPPVTKQQRRKGKERQQEEEEDDFVSEEAFSNWKKNYAGKGFVGERGFSQLISPFKELIEQRGWEKILQTSKIWLCSSCQIILLQPCWEKRELCFCQRCLGTIRS